MRARNIKPGFWKNEELVELPFETRLLFIGLWNLADREGRIENRPKRIKIEIFPADDVDIAQGITRLSEAGLVKVYQARGKNCIEVVNFKKHQNPHHREAPSDLPSSDEVNEIDAQVIENKGASESPRPAPDKPKESRADSGFLNPDSGFSDSSSDEPIKPKRKTSTQIPASFELTEDLRRKAVKYWLDRDRPDLNPDEIFDGFVSHHRARGSRMVDWDAAWQTWYTKAVQFQRPPPNNVSRLPVNDTREQRKRVSAALMNINDTSW